MARTTEPPWFPVAPKTVISLVIVDVVVKDLLRAVIADILLGNVLSDGIDRSMCCSNVL
jgi:hypothetical protein